MLAKCITCFALFAETDKISVGRAMKKDDFCSDWTKSVVHISSLYHSIPDLVFKEMTFFLEQKDAINKSFIL